MTKEQIYQEIRNRSPIYSGEAPELLEDLQEFKNDELLQDLEVVYQEWGALPRIYRTDEKEEIFHIQQCESLFEFLTEAIFNHADSSVIPFLLKYVPSDDDVSDLVFMEDYSSEQICNGISDSRYFGESYIPVLLGCIHELVPRAMMSTKSFFFDMLYDNFNKFSETQPLIRNLYLAEKEPFIKILDCSIEQSLEELKRKNGQEAMNQAISRISRPIVSVNYDDESVDQKAFIRQAFVKLHGL
ncbi:hypothetical protein HE1_00019 [Holospora elegans E1]|uniref:Uncharacterized protein n=1 Tax=Holospora elegans E1 TaxID=1427503 RepID=A0A023DXQ5_9PROT|nr:hypothetical protein [Holospora elegans]GAJ45710.1 hypothetical protein HE1_00019 [Holospora elegans E1]